MDENTKSWWRISLASPKLRKYYSSRLSNIILQSNGSSRPPGVSTSHDPGDEAKPTYRWTTKDVMWLKNTAAGLHNTPVQGCEYPHYAGYTPLLLGICSWSVVT